MAASVVAALAMLVLAVLGGVLFGESPLLPFRMAASLFFHDAEFRHMPAWVAIPVGLAIHFGVSMVYGFSFGLLLTDERKRQRQRPLLQAAIGMLVGLGAYLIDIQLIARFWYPWMLEPPQVGVALLHVLGFGLPLGVMAPIVDARSRSRSSARPSEWDGTRGWREV